MERKPRIGISRLFAMALSLCVPLVTAAQSPQPMNVLFIVVDDLRRELGCYGVDEVISPNIDRLAKKGILCHNAFAQYPVCNPSRASFLSGKRPDETGIVTNSVPFRKALPDLVSLPQLFQQNGYFTAGIGKIFNLAEPKDGKSVLFKDPLSWDYFHDSLHDTTAPGRKGEGRNLTKGKLPWCSWLAAEGGDLDQPDGQNAAAAIRILEEHHDKPFFMGLGFHKPHDPFIAPETEKWQGLHNTFTAISKQSWTDAQMLYRAAWRAGLTDAELDELAIASSTWEKYDHGYWFKEKLFRKLYKQFAKNAEQQKALKRAYFTRDFDAMALLIAGS